MPSPPTPPPFDHRLLIYPTAVMGLTFAALIAAEAVVEGDATALMVQIGVAGTAAATLVGLVVKRLAGIESQSETQTEDIKQIKGSLNGALDRRLSLIEMHVIAHGTKIDRIEAMIDERLPAREE